MQTTLFIINGKEVYLDIQSGFIASIDKPEFSDIAKYLIREWGVESNTTDVISYIAQTVVITDPLRKEHACSYILESRRERDSQTNIYMQSLTGTDSLLNDYEEHGFDIDKGGIIELVSYALGEGMEQDSFDEYNFSFRTETK